MAKKHDQLTALGPQRAFTGEHLDQIAFPLGGIGTGSVSLSGRGDLVDWEIFNRPNFGGRLQKTLPIIYAREQGKDPVCRVVKSPPLPPFTHGGGGDPHDHGEGFPHMDGATFRGEYPFAWIDFESKDLPVQVSLEAYNPFIPSEPDDSGYPVAVLKYTVKNPKRSPVDVSLAWSLLNAVGSIGEGGKDRTFGSVEHGLGKNVNARVDEDGLRGVFMTTKKYRKSHARYGSMALTTPEKNVSVLTHWLRESWFAPRHEFWDHFSTQGHFEDMQHDYGPSPDGNTDACALAVRARLRPGQSRTFTFYISWHMPNFEKYWHNLEAIVGQLTGKQAGKRIQMPTWRNYYAKQFSDALDAAKKLHRDEKKLYALSKQFHDALFSSTLPPHVLDAASSQMSILKTQTCLRLTDGTFYGFEGCAPIAGCCEGSCTHVWNYQQALPFLFPSLERSMREADYKYNLKANGAMDFRLGLPLGEPPIAFRPCADGQLGGVVKAYRDWKISGDDQWLAKLWPDLKKSLEYAWQDWDKDMDGVLKTFQHNTYDIDFLGPNTMCETFYLAALLAGAEMAEALDQPDAAEQYRAIYKKGRRWIEDNLYNGEYYIQQYDPKEAPVHQYGEGCLADQLLGQQIAMIAGLPDVLDSRRIKKTLRSIHKYNFRQNLTNHANAQRVYALNDEAGLLLCSWPHGNRPEVPFVYSDEVWTGIEYQVAAHCIHAGLVNEGLEIIQAVRERHDGKKRNPWDEYECGHHYARAMASWGLILTLGGFKYDQRAGLIGFDPRIHADDFRTFWSLDGAWGVYEQKGKKAKLTVLYGKLPLKTLDLAKFADAGKVKVKSTGKPQTVPVKDGCIQLPRRLSLAKGKSIEVTA